MSLKIAKLALNEKTKGRFFFEEFKLKFNTITYFVEIYNLPFTALNFDTIFFFLIF